VFQIELSKKDLDLLKKIKSFFGVGNIIERKMSGRESIKYRIQSIKDLKVIINHFDKYQIISKKRSDYELFKKAINCINEKKHLTIEGVREIVSIKATMNLGLSDELKATFLDITSVERPCVLDPEIPNPQ